MPCFFLFLSAEVCYNAGAFCDSHEANNVLKVIIEKGVDVNEDNSKYKILNYVAEKGFIETVELLIDAEANVNAADEHGWTPLHKSTSSRKLDLIIDFFTQTNFMVVFFIHRWHSWNCRALVWSWC